MSGPTTELQRPAVGEASDRDECSALSTAQYGDARRAGSRLGQQLADFAVEGKRTLGVASGRAGGRFFVLVGGEAAKAERQLADLGGNRDDLALLWRHLECRGMRNERFAVLAV